MSQPAPLPSMLLSPRDYERLKFYTRIVNDHRKRREPFSEAEVAALILRMSLDALDTTIVASTA